MEKKVWVYEFYGWKNAVMASRHWQYVPRARCRVYRDRSHVPRVWVLEVTRG